MKYAIVIDCSGSMTGWGSTVEAVYTGLREKLLEMAYRNAFTSVYFLSDKILHWTDLSSPETIMRIFLNNVGGPTNVYALRDFERVYDCIFVISDGQVPIEHSISWEKFIFVTDKKNYLEVSHNVKYQSRHGARVLVIEPRELRFWEKVGRFIWKYTFWIGDTTVHGRS
jgi:hypothetical protein